MAWVKWIREIRVVERPFLGYWQTRDYFRWERDMGEPTLVALSRNARQGADRPAHQWLHVLLGKPDADIRGGMGRRDAGRAVEVSVEDDDWQPAEFIGPDVCHAWRFWETYWTPERTGRYSLLCRAFDAEGRVQPSDQQPDRESYLANWSVPVEVHGGRSCGGRRV